MNASTQSHRFGIVFVISGPSGAGKSSVCNMLMETDPYLHFSISCTTRSQRPGEHHGKDYYFISSDEFQERIERQEFIEHAEVHGHRYGTLRSEVDRFIEIGQDVILDIDVQGAINLRKIEQSASTMRSVINYSYILLAPPSYQELAKRLHERKTDTAEVIQRRLTTARNELAQWRRYDYLIINQNLTDTIATISAIVTAERAKTRILKASDPWA